MQYDQPFKSEASKSMTSKIVKNWFGEDFSQLSPELQKLHLEGGVLEGPVDIEFGKGIAGVWGKLLSKRLKLPSAGKNNLQVSIFHTEEALHWNRKFNDSLVMKSTFKPIKTIKDGYWLENTGPLQIRLTVDVKNHGWHWRCLGVKVFGVPIPVWSFPQLQAYKCIENDGYRFFVGFKVPPIGLLLSYSGVLQKR